MPTYVQPQATAFAAQAAIPNLVARPLRAHISGPHAFLVRYNDTTERELGALGTYDSTLDTPYAWPNQPADSVVDLTYAKLWMTEALLHYFSVGAAGGDNILTVANYSNRIHSSVLNFKTNGAYARDAAFLDRDVQIGDIVKVRAIDINSVAQTLWTTVTGLIGDVVASAVGAAAADAGNAIGQALSVVPSQVAGPFNCVGMTANAAAYQGLPSGYITETYDILVTAGSVHANFTTATLRVISGSGTDNVVSVVPAAVGMPTTIGTRGLTVTFDELDADACSDSASDADIPIEDLIVGQRWHVVVHQAFTPAVATSGGTYAGGSTTAYIVTVTRGGLLGALPAAQPQISVSTSNGSDLSGPTNVPAAATAVAVGTQGLTISFTGAGLREGDLYVIVATSASTGPMRTLVLGNNLASTVSSGTLVDLDLYILETLLPVPQDQVGNAPNMNWTVDAADITVNSGMQAYNSTWTSDGVPVALDVFGDDGQGYGNLFVEYRAWLSDLSNKVLSAQVAPGSTTAQILAVLDPLISGALDPDNPLMQAVFIAMENSNGEAVMFTGVSDPTVLGDWADAVASVVGRDDVYGLVPLSQDPAVLALYEAHVTAMSVDDIGLWRHLWVSLTDVPLLPLVTAGTTVPGHDAATTTDGLACLCTILNNPNVAGTHYTLVTCTSGNAAFLANGVTAGDTLRATFVGDGFGNYTYTEYTIASVLSAETLLLVAGPGTAVNTASMVEVWRTLTPAAEEAAIAAQAAVFTSNRVEPVWPDSVLNGSTVLPGYHVCAALAGLASGILPHQSLLRLQIVGFTDVSRSYNKFLPAQLDAMAAAGIWVVTQDPVSLDIYSRDAVTDNADQTDLVNADEMCVRNLDSIRYRLKETYDTYIGATNATSVVLQRLQLDTNTALTMLESEAYNSNLGAQLIAGSILALNRSAVFLNQFVVTLSLTIPTTTTQITVTANVVIG